MNKAQRTAASTPPNPPFARGGKFVVPSKATIVPLLLLLPVFAHAAEPDPRRPFAIHVVDDQTGRGVPLVELKTVNDVVFITDSAGAAAIDEPGLMDQSVFFHVKSHGYIFPKDGFGYAGKALAVKPGGSATLKIHRVNVAERLYRVTGGGIYRDTLLLGETPPIKQPALNAKVFGSDSVLMAPYRGKLQWFWGDTNRPSYPLGNFSTPGATSQPPEQGGLDPDVGINLDYYVDDTGFARPTAKLPGDGPTWVFGMAAFREESGREQLVGAYSKIRPPMETYEHGLAAFNPEKNVFEKVVAFPLKSAIRPSGHTLQRTENGETWIYFTTPFPLTRVRARMADLSDITRYESFTCLEPGSTLDRPQIARGADGRPHYAWRADTPVVGPAEQAKLVRSGALKDDEALLALRDVETGKPILAHNGCTYWNPYRKRWIAIFTQSFGTSLLGEIWFAEADTPVGPWVYARKILTHDKYSFYNPKHHPEFNKEGGRVIFFEGTYTASFSGNPVSTPRYDYNQIMHKLDLADPRLNLPVPVYDVSGAFATGPEAAQSSAPAFFALERPAPGAVAFNGALERVETGKGAFYAFPVDAKDAPTSTIPYVHRAGEAPRFRAWKATTNISLKMH